MSTCLAPKSATSSTPPRRRRSTSASSSASTETSRGSSRRSASSSRKSGSGSRVGELRAEERLDRLRIRDVLSGEGGERLELPLAPFARRLGDRRVDVVGEELERMRLERLFAHEEQRRARREERHGRGAHAARRAAGGRRRARLPTWSWFCAQTTSRRGSCPCPCRVVAEPRDRAVARVVAVLLAGEEDVQLVMGPVGPLRVVSPLVDRPPVVDLHLRDDERTGIRVAGHARRARRRCARASRRRSRARRRAEDRRCGSRGPRALRSGSPIRARRAAL